MLERIRRPSLTQMVQERVRSLRKKLKYGQRLEDKLVEVAPISNQNWWIEGDEEEIKVEIKDELEENDDLDPSHFGPPLEQ